MVATPTRFLTPQILPQMLLGQRLIHAINHCIESHQMLPNIAEMIGQDLNVEICALLFINQETLSLQGVVWTREQTILLKAGSDWLENNWFQKIQLQEYPLLFNSKVTPSTIIQLTQNIFLRSGIGLRTIFQGQVNGVVIIGSSQPQKYSLEKAKLIEIADSLAIANHLFQSSQSIPKTKVETIKSVTQNHNLTIDENLIKAWYEATRQKLEQQRQTNDQLIHNIVTIMSDQTRNPLTNIRMGIEMLRRNLHSPENSNKGLDLIEQEWRKLNDINEEILQLKTLKLNHINLQFSQVNLNHFFQQLVTSHESKWRETSYLLIIKTDLPENLPVINSNVSYLQRIFDELFINAKKFALKNTEITLKIKEFNENNQAYIRLELSNLTSSIKCNNLNHFFDPFYRDQWVIDTAISGVGLGLTIIKELVEQLNGKITIKCNSISISNHCLITVIVIFPVN